jgi:hypothetical protein
MIDGQEEGKPKTYQAKNYHNPGVKVSFGYVTENPQG